MKLWSMLTVSTAALQKPEWHRKFSIFNHLNILLKCRALFLTESYLLKLL